MKPLLSGHFPKCPARFVKIAQCLATINLQRLLCTVIKFHVVKKANEAVLYFVQNIGEFLTAKCIDLSLLIDNSTYFKDVIQC